MESYMREGGLRAQRCLGRFIALSLNQSFPISESIIGNLLNVRATGDFRQGFVAILDGNRSVSIKVQLIRLAFTVRYEM